MVAEFSIVWETQAFRGALVQIVGQAELAAKEATGLVALAVVRQAKINSTGPPRWISGERPGEGPGVRSGRHRNSIRIVGQGVDGVGWYTDVSATMAYSRRLELGFRGVDSWGRPYNQPPYAYLEPAMTLVEHTLAEGIFEAAWARAIEKG